ncbi:MAG: hypothetical protein IKL55_04545 [Clostridia bacterium]|nr:hypothetical protein [Clostridia bacterium]
MEQTFTNVFFEESYPAAEERLEKLRKNDKYPEVKAYIVQEKDGSWRVLRRIKINLSQQTNTPAATLQRLLQYRLKQKARR